MVINIVFIILQECDSTVSFRDIAAGKFEVVISHPEAPVSYTHLTLPTIVGV